jgi:hypothetical protein
MMEEIGQQHQIVAASKIFLKRVTGDYLVAILHTGLTSQPLCHGEHIRPIERHNFGGRATFRDIDSEEPCPAAMSNTRDTAGRICCASRAISSAGLAISGIMDLAKSTQRGCSGATVPPYPDAVPPLRTASVRFWNASVNLGACRKPNADPR